MSQENIFNCQLEETPGSFVVAVDSRTLTTRMQLWSCQHHQSVVENCLEMYSQPSEMAHCPPYPERLPAMTNLGWNQCIQARLVLHDSTRATVRWFHGCVVGSFEGAPHQQLAELCTTGVFLPALKREQALNVFFLDCGHERVDSLKALSCHDSGR